MILELVVSVLLLMLYVLILYRIGRSPFRLLFIGIIFGLLVFPLAGTLEFYWPTLTGIYLKESQGNIIYFPVIEETLKFLLIFLTFWILKLKPKTYEIMLCKKELTVGASVGLGFAFFETIGYSGLLVIIFRGFTTWLMHMTTSTLLSYSIVIIWALKSKRKMIFVLVLVSCAIIIHVLFNYMGYV